MSHGKYFSLDEARKTSDFKRFSQEHPSQGNENLFWRLLKAMIQGKPRNPKAKQETSAPELSEGCTETQTPPGTLTDVD